MLHLVSGGSAAVGGPVRAPALTRRTVTWAEREFAPRLSTCLERVLPALVELVLAPGAHPSCRTALCAFLCTLIVECAQSLHSSCLPALFDALLSCSTPTAAATAESASESESAAKAAHSTSNPEDYVERVLACGREIRVSVSLVPSQTDALTKTQSVTVQKPLREFLVDRLRSRLVEEADSLPHVLRTSPAPARRLAALARISALIGALGRCGALETQLPATVARLVSALVVGAGALDVRRCTGFLELQLCSDALDEATSTAASREVRTPNVAAGASDRFHLRDFPKRDFEYLYEEAAVELYLECLTSLGRYAHPVALVDHLQELLSPNQSSSCHVVYALGHVVAGLLSRPPASNFESVSASLLFALVDRLLDSVKQIDECLVGVFSVPTSRAAHRSRELSLYSALCFETLARLALAFTSGRTSFGGAEGSSSELLDGTAEDNEQLYLLRVLYPTLNATQSAFAVVRETALCSLQYMRRALGQSSVAELLRANADYLVDDVCARMRRCRDFVLHDSDPDATAITGSGIAAAEDGAEQQTTSTVWSAGFPLLQPVNVLRALLACGGPQLVPLVGDVIECLLQWLDDLYVRSDAETALYIECLGEYCRAVQRSNAVPTSGDCVDGDGDAQRAQLSPFPATPAEHFPVAEGNAMASVAALSSSSEALSSEALRVLREVRACHRRVSAFREELRAARGHCEQHSEKDVVERMQRPPHELREQEMQQTLERASEPESEQSQEAQKQLPPPLHLQLVQSCVRRSAQYISAPSARVQQVAVCLLRSAAQALSNNESTFSS